MHVLDFGLDVVIELSRRIVSDQRRKIAELYIGQQEFRERIRQVNTEHRPEIVGAIAGASIQTQFKVTRPQVRSLGHRQAWNHAQANDQSATTLYILPHPAIEHSAFPLMEIWIHPTVTARDPGG